jgi:hypothetical protein
MAFAQVPYAFFGLGESAAKLFVGLGLYMSSSPPAASTQARRCGRPLGGDCRQLAQAPSYQGMLNGFENAVASRIIFLTRHCALGPDTLSVNTPSKSCPNK